MRLSLRENGQAGRLGIVSAVAAILLALALAVPAGAEAIEPPVAAPDPATEGAAATEEVQPAAGEEVEEAPTEVQPAAGQEAEEAPAPTTPAEPAEAAGSPVAAPPASSATASPPPAAPAPPPAASASLSEKSVPLSEEPVPAAPVEPRAAAATVQESTGVPVGGRTSEIVERVRQDPASAAAPAVEDAAQTLRSQASLETAQTLQTAQSTVRRTSSSAELLSMAAKPVHGVLAVGYVATPAVERTAPSASAPAGFDPPASAARGASAVGHEASAVGHQLGGLPAGERIPGLRDHALAMRSGASGRIESEAPHRAAHSAGSSPPAMTAAADPDRGRVTTGQPNGSRPDSPVPPPPPGSPGVASGSGGSFFVPLAALLALLALVAPATFRRPREVPDFLAPTPFVCALERPG